MAVVRLLAWALIHDCRCGAAGRPRVCGLLPRHARHRDSRRGCGDSGDSGNGGDGGDGEIGTDSRLQARAEARRPDDHQPQLRMYGYFDMILSRREVQWLEKYKPEAQPSDEAYTATDGGGRGKKKEDLDQESCIPQPPRRATRAV